MAGRGLLSLLGRERAIIASALVFMTALAWIWVLVGSGTGMSATAMSTWQFPPPRPSMTTQGAWSAAYWLTMLAMWWVMMIAMMVPSAASMILLYARVVRHAPQQDDVRGALAPTAMFAAGYLVCWLAFSAFATALQFALERSLLLDGMLMWPAERWLTAALLAAAGLFQLSSLKTVCLAECRAPAAFLTRHWRPGRLGAFRMGIIHGAYCVGCCWALMLLLFAAGIMNLVWIAGLAIIVLIEKLAPFGAQLSKALAVLLLVGAAVLVAT